MGSPPTEETQGDMLERSSSISEDYLRYLSNPHHTEKRFPVDRKKLERLIIAGGKDNESAEDYFKRIMEETGTLVLWPSRLKIGAKSKKGRRHRSMLCGCSVNLTHYCMPCGW